MPVTADTPTFCASASTEGWASDEGRGLPSTGGAGNVDVNDNVTRMILNFHLSSRTSLH
jgi:hypothetical protein